MPDIPQLKFQKDLQETIKAFQRPDPLVGFQEIMKGLQPFDPFVPLREIMRGVQAPDPLVGLREIIEGIQASDPLAGFLEIIKELRLNGIAEAISADKWPLAYTSAKDIILNDDSTFTVNSTKLSYIEVQNIANRIVDRKVGQSIKGLEHAITGIAADIRALKNPALEKILTFLIYPIIIGLILSVVNPIMDYYIKKSLSAEKRETEKKIKKHVAMVVGDMGTLDSYRLISSKALNIRSKASRKSAILGQIYLGHIVVLVKKDKDWSLVTWSDNDSGVMIQGWVFSRYLSKLR